MSKACPLNTNFVNVTMMAEKELPETHLLSISLFNIILLKEKHHSTIENTF